MIEQVIRSVLSQTLLPTRWIIVDDGSTDDTAAIVEMYRAGHPFMALLRVHDKHPRNFTAQVHAINRGLDALRGLDCMCIGNLDADITFEPSYFERLLHLFRDQQSLGLAGGYIYEPRAGAFECRQGNSEDSVAHGVQMFRRECLQQLGGYRPFSWGGTDWHAAISAQMNGWEVRSIPELKAYHHRPTGGGFGRLRYLYRGGGMAHYMGSHPVFECFKTLHRVMHRPVLLGALVRFAGYLFASLRCRPLEVPEEFADFLRRDQMRRLRDRLLMRTGTRRPQAPMMV